MYFVLKINNISDDRFLFAKAYYFLFCEQLSFIRVWSQYAESFFFVAFCKARPFSVFEACNLSYSFEMFEFFGIFAPFP